MRQSCDTCSVQPLATFKPKRRKCLGLSLSLWISNETHCYWYHVFFSTDTTTALFLNATDRWSTILDLRGVTKQSKQRIHDMLGWANIFLSHKQTFHFTSFSTGFGYLLSHIWSSWRPPKLLSSPQSQLKGRKGSDGWLRSIALILAVHLGKCLIFTKG